MGFNFNQYLIVDEGADGFTGLGLSARERAPGAVMPIEKLRYVGLSHFEADECELVPCGRAGASRSAPARRDGLRGDFADRAPRGSPTRSLLGRTTVGSTRRTCRTRGNAGS
jgi:hypothetical protein